MKLTCLCPFENVEFSVQDSVQMFIYVQHFISYNLFVFELKRIIVRQKLVSKIKNIDFTKHCT